MVLACTHKLPAHAQVGMRQAGPMQPGSWASSQQHPQYLLQIGARERLEGSSKWKQQVMLRTYSSLELGQSWHSSLGTYGGPQSGGSSSGADWSWSSLQQQEHMLAVLAVLEAGIQHGYLLADQRTSRWQPAGEQRREDGAGVQRQRAQQSVGGMQQCRHHIQRRKKQGEQL